LDAALERAARAEEQRDVADRQVCISDDFDLLACENDIYYTQSREALVKAAAAVENAARDRQALLDRAASAETSASTSAAALADAEVQLRAARADAATAAAQAADAIRQLGDTRSRLAAATDAAARTQERERLAFDARLREMGDQVRLWQWMPRFKGGGLASGGR
jgi:hypothetical protein